MVETRSKIRSIILGITGFIAALILIRILIDLFTDEVNTYGFVDIIREITNIFIDPFNNAIEISADSDFARLNANAVLALVSVVILGILIAEVVSSFLQDSVVEIFRNIVDAFFKIIEGLLFIRIILDLFYVSADNTFGEVIIPLTNWSHAITDITFLDDRIYLSAVITLTLVVILDITSDALISSLFDRKKVSTSRNGVPAQVTVKNNQPTQNRQAPIHHVINVNVPLPPPNQPPPNHPR